MREKAASIKRGRLFLCTVATAPLSISLSKGGARTRPEGTKALSPGQSEVKRNGTLGAQRCLIPPTPCRGNSILID